MSAADSARYLDLVRHDFEVLRLLTSSARADWFEAVRDGLIPILEREGAERVPRVDPSPFLG
jgi:hypothetical protein